MLICDGETWQVSFEGELSMQILLDEQVRRSLAPEWEKSSG
jgi:hypothetical protein